MQTATLSPSKLSHWLTLFSASIGVINGLLGCAAVSSYYVNGSLINGFAGMLPGLLNSLTCLATIPLATVGVAFGWIALKHNPDERGLAWVGIALNSLYAANFMLLAFILVSTSRF